MRYRNRIIAVMLLVVMLVSSVQIGPKQAQASGKVRFERLNLNYISCYVVSINNSRIKYRDYWGDGYKKKVHTAKFTKHTKFYRHMKYKPSRGDCCKKSTKKKAIKCIRNKDYDTSSYNDLVDMRIKNGKVEVLVFAIKHEHP